MIFCHFTCIEFFEIKLENMDKKGELYGKARVG